MKYYDLITPEGTKDLLFGECIVRRNIEKTLFKIFKSRGYSEMITPGLEFFDVFNLNSRYFPQENLYKLTDSKGRLLVMRPDSTMPIARVVATRLRDAVLPLKLCYNQTVYRTEPALKGRSDEIVQTGIELIGSELRIADLEVISTAIDSLRMLGKPFSLEIGNIGIFKALADKLDVSEKFKEKIRRRIETKNFPALNDLLDSLGSNPVIDALKKLPALFGGEEVFELFEVDRIVEFRIDAKSVFLLAFRPGIAHAFRAGVEDPFRGRVLQPIFRRREAERDLLAARDPTLSRRVDDRPVKDAFLGFKVSPGQAQIHDGASFKPVERVGRREPTAVIRRYIRVEVHRPTHIRIVKRAPVVR